MKIRSYQMGGIAYTPLDTPTQATATTATGSSDSVAKVPGFAKEMIDIVKENGLDSDVTTFLRHVEQAVNRTGDPTGNNLTMSDIIRIQREANKVRQNYENYKTAVDVLKDQAAWGDVATDEKGRLWVLKDGNLTTVSPGAYEETKMQLLTYQDLISIRERSPQFAFHQNILHDVTAAIGMKTIATYANDLIGKFGKTDLTGYTSKQASSIERGLNVLMAGGPNGVYKFTKEEQYGDSDFGAALDYLYHALPAQYRNSLTAKAVAEGYEANPYGAKTLLAQMITADTSRKLAVDYDQTASKAGGYSTGSESSESLTQDTLPDQIARGDLMQDTAFLSPAAERASDKALMAFQAWNAGPLVDEHKKLLTTNNLNTLLPQIYGMRAADTSSIAFGSQTVVNNPTQKAALVWDGQSQLKRVALPKKMTANGKIVPDLDAMTKFNEVLGWAKDHPGVTQMELRERLGNISNLVDITPNNEMIFRPEVMGYFLTFAAYANRDLLPVDKKDKFLEHISREEGRSLKGLYNNLVRFGDPTPSKKAKPANDVSEAKGNDFYYGNVYMPIVDPTQGYLMSGDQYMPKSTFTNIAKTAELGQQVLQTQRMDPWNTNF